MTFALFFLIAAWIAIGAGIVQQIDMTPVQKVGLVIIWPFIAIYVVIYHLVAVWPRRFY